MIAAAIHLGHLPSHRLPTVGEVMALPDFDRSLSSYIGTLFYKGRDERGIAVHTLGMGPEWRAGTEAVRSFLEINGVAPDSIHLVHALDRITFGTKLGGALSRRYGFRRSGRYLAAAGIRRSYPLLLKLVEEVKKDLHRTSW